MFGEPETLIVVYKNELFVNLLRKLIETKDDVDEEHIVGVTDNSVRIVAWDEKVWLDQKRAGNINNKVLFLGKIKGWDQLMPIVDVQFDEFGIKYGWAGNKAILIAETAPLDDKKLYNSFLEELNKLDIPEEIKSDKVEIQEEVEEKTNLFSKAKGFFKKHVAEPLSPERKKIIKQLYFFGINKLYRNHLETFINE